MRWLWAIRRSGGNARVVAPDRPRPAAAGRGRGEGPRRKLHESAEDLLEHRLSFTEDKVRGKAEHLYSTPLEESSPALLVDFRFWIEVLSSVELDGNTSRWAEEVDDVPSAGILAAELEPGELPTSE